MFVRSTRPGRLELPGNPYTNTHATPESSDVTDRSRHACTPRGAYQAPLSRSRPGTLFKSIQPSADYASTWVRKYCAARRIVPQCSSKYQWWPNAAKWIWIGNSKQLPAR